MNNKLRIGWFSFSCCEDSTIIFTEMLNDHYKEWKKVIEFTSILVMQRRETLDNMDVAFVEGAIASEEQAEKLKLIRSKAKKLIAIGSCACAGFPSAQRNQFSEEKRREIASLLIRFKYAEQVKKISEVVTVDASVPGCPMDEKQFLKILHTMLVDFNIVTTEGKSTP